MQVGPAALASIQRFSFVRYRSAEPFRQRLDGEVLRDIPVTQGKRKPNQDMTRYLPTESALGLVFWAK